MNMRRREWRVLSLVAPSLRLDANASRFPFTVKAEYPITVQDMMRIYRDTYEGTPYDKANVNDWYVPDGRGGFYKSPFATPDVSSEFRKAGGRAQRAQHLHTGLLVLHHPAVPQLAAASGGHPGVVRPEPD